MVKQSLAKRPKPKSVKTVKPISFWDNEPLQRKIVGWIFAVVAVFLVYSFFTFGSPVGFFLEHKPFPGAQSKELTTGRNKRFAVADSIGRIMNTGPIKPTYSSRLYTLDRCVKGEHQLPIAGATNDNYAYWCDIKIYQYYVFDQSTCDILNMLSKVSSLQSSAYNGATCGDSATRNSLTTKSREPFFDGPDATITVLPVAELKAHGMLAFTYVQGYECNTSADRPVAYCHDGGKPWTVDAGAIDPSSQTVVAVDASGTYYQK